jgi:holo-[acyl-carrier protein] synthase
MTSILKSGIDLIEIDRLERSIERHADRFLKRIFTHQELADCHGRPESLAARFAAKEAAVKALGTGIGKISWLEVEIQRNAENQPELILHGEALAQAKKLKLTCWSVSLSHDRHMAIAVVVASGDG